MLTEKEESVRILGILSAITTTRIERRIFVIYRKAFPPAPAVEDEPDLVETLPPKCLG